MLLYPFPEEHVGNADLKCVCIKPDPGCFTKPEVEPSLAKLFSKR